MPSCIFSALCLSACLLLITADNFWGVPVSKQKERQNSDKVRQDIRPKRSGSSGGSFDELQRLASEMDSNTDYMADILGELGSLTSEDINHVLDGVLESPEFAEYMTPETVRSVIEMNPFLSEIPEIKTLLDSDTFNDPVKFKSIMREGLSKIKEHTTEIVQAFSDPSMRKYMDTFVESLSDPRLLSSIQETMKESLGALNLDPIDFETVRQELEQNPETRVQMQKLIEMFGVEDSEAELLDLLQDKGKWDAMMKEVSKINLFDQESLLDPEANRRA